MKTTSVKKKSKRPETRTGRPPIYGDRMERRTISLSLPGGTMRWVFRIAHSEKHISQTIRDLIINAHNAAMAKSLSRIASIPK